MSTIRMMLPLYLILAAVVSAGQASYMDGKPAEPEGYIEVSPRWIKQQRGAHCKADGMNFKGIGICLVGNFSKHRVSVKQIESLVYLVRILKKYYDIPNRNIIGHGSVKGAATECPGSKFPWREFWLKLNSKK